MYNIYHLVESEHGVVRKVRHPRHVLQEPEPAQGFWVYVPSGTVLNVRTTVKQKCGAVPRRARIVEG